MPQMLELGGEALRAVQRKMNPMIDQFDRCVQIAVDTLRQIDDHEARISEHRHSINILKQSLVATLTRASQGMDRAELIEMAWQLYWHTPINAEPLATMLNVREGMALNKLIGGFPSGDFCKWCGEELLIMSRTERKELEKSGRPWTKELCSKCEKRRIELSSERYQQEQAERAAELLRLKRIPYREYLGTEHWQRVRESALKRSWYRCQLCNSDGLLDVHHRTYERRGEERASDVIVLCRQCHSKFHDKA